MPRERFGTPWPHSSRISAITVSTRRRCARLHKLSGESVWSVSFAGQYRTVLHLGEQQRPGHAHIVWEFIGSHAEYEREY